MLLLSHDCALACRCPGPRPVCIGFGSMASGDGERQSEIAVRACAAPG
ncbi:hypothetical protein [Streptomyces litmocidini]